MKEQEHENTLQYIQEFLQHMFGGTPQGKLEVPTKYFIDSNPHTKVGIYLLQIEYKMIFLQEQKHRPKTLNIIA